MAINMPAVLVYALALSVAAALECPLVTCEELQAGLCASKVSDTRFLINTIPCPAGTACSAQRLYEDWWFQAITDANDAYPCWNTADFHTLSYSEFAGLSVWPCGQREQNKDLKVGSHPKACETDHDCELQDGTLGHCYCTLTRYSNTTITNGFCSPDISSSLFAETWGQCQSDNLLTDELSGSYYHLYQRAYHILQAEAPCAKGLFWEFLELDAIQAAINTADAVTLMLAASATLLFT